MRAHGCPLWANSANIPGFPGTAISRTSNELSSAGQNNPDFGELARLRIDFNSASVLLDDDVVTDGKAGASSLARGLSREAWIEHLFFHIRRNADAVVANTDFNAIAKTPRRGNKSRLISVATSLSFTFVCGIKSVRDQIQQSSRDLLREHVCLAGPPDQMSAR